jgi:hypothetical protein
VLDDRARLRDSSLDGAVGAQRRAERPGDVGVDDRHERGALEVQQLRRLGDAAPLERDDLADRLGDTIPDALALPLLVGRGHEVPLAAKRQEPREIPGLEQGRHRCAV